MQITQLDHVNIRTTQLEKMVGWYTEILGMTIGDRPDFPFPGAWLYGNGQAMVHMVGVEDDPLVGSEVNLKLEHFAFRAEGAAAFEQRLVSAEEPYRRVDIAQINTAAFNLWDPDGNHIHVDFALEQ